MKVLHLIAFASGLVLPIQIAFNNRLTAYSGNAVISSLWSFATGTIVLFVYAITSYKDLTKSLQQIGQAPPHAWLGGVVGCFYVVSTLLVAPRIGLALSLGLVILGQLSMSLLIDNFGWFGMEVRSLTWLKGVGILLVLSGILLIKNG